MLCWLSASTPALPSPSKPSSGKILIVVHSSSLPLIFLHRSLGDFPLSREEHGRWMDLLYVTLIILILILFLFLFQLEEGATAQDLARAQVSAGDATMTRLWEHVKQVQQWTKSLRIVCFISSSSFRMVERLMSRLTKILEYRWILLSQNVSPAHFTEFKFHSFEVD